MNSQINNFFIQKRLFFLIFTLLLFGGYSCSSTWNKISSSLSHEENEEGKEVEIKKPFVPQSVKKIEKKEKIITTRQEEKKPEQPELTIEEIITEAETAKEPAPSSTPAPKEETRQQENIQPPAKAPQLTFSNPNPGNHTVEIENGSVLFTPENLTVTTGDTIKWINNDVTIDAHLFQSVPGTHPFDKNKDEIPSTNLYGTQTYEHTFNSIGVYPYFCFIHKGMIGEVTVVRPGQTVVAMKVELASLTSHKKKNIGGSTKKLTAKQMILIPAGTFIMGSPDTPTEGPPHLEKVAKFYIDKYEVTNEEYEEFVDATDYIGKGKWRAPYKTGKEKHPVTQVTYGDAVAYAKWAKKRLPSEIEWEKAARGKDKRMWPWGDEYDNEVTNVYGPDEYITTSPVGIFEEDLSPHGVFDMAGNVSEWTSSKYIAYRNSPSPNYPDFTPKKQVIRGGSFNTIDEDQVRTHSRIGSTPERFFNSVGFRLVKD